MEIAIYGGSFNPPTMAHKTVMDACLKTDFDEVWVMPSGSRPDKEGLRDGIRLTMLHLLKHEFYPYENRLQISDFELRLPRPTQTYRTFQALRDAYPQVQFRFVIGADAYHSLPSWQYGSWLMKHLPTVVVPRPGYSLPDKADVTLLGLSDTPDISSSVVRRRICTGQEVDGLIPGTVRDYIQQLGLYACRTQLEN